MTTPRLICGQRRTLTNFEGACSFLPAVVKPEAAYKTLTDPTQGCFKGLPRPYRTGGVTERTEADDDGRAFEASLWPAKQRVSQFIADHTSPIVVGKARLQEKPVAVIYNPSSGSKTNIRGKIEAKLSEHGISASFFETKRYMHAWQLAEEEIDLSQYSALVGVGGDGTLHEVINGMLMRKDGKRLPVSLIPNGSGNDLVGCFGISNLDQALDWLVTGDTVKMDVNKVLVDYEHESEIPECEVRSSQFRYSVINAAIGFIAKVVHKADALKPYTGRGCYKAAGIYNFFKNSAEYFAVSIEQPDGSLIEIPREPTMLTVIMNGKYGGGRIPLTPCAMLNDGLFDMIFQHGPASTQEFLRVCRDVLLSQGDHIYLETQSYFRGRKLRITNCNEAI